MRPLAGDKVEERMKRSSLQIVSIIFLFATEKSDGFQKWRVEFCTGAPTNVSLPLTVRQRGEPDLRLIARYDSNPSTVPIYWMWRISHWTDSSGLEFEAIHHKIFLANIPPEITFFAVSHGLNLLTLNRAWRMSRYIVRAGIGIGLVHPENTVRGKKLGEDGGILGWGYYVTAPSFLCSVGKETILSDSYFVTTEAIVAGSFSRIDVVDGSADVYNLAVHVVIGLGYSFRGRH